MKTRGTTLLSVTDLTDRERSVVCDVASLGPLLAGWWAELGLTSAASRSHARMLRDAITSGNWVAAHKIADHVSLDVSIVAVKGDAPVWAPSDDWRAL